MSEEPKSIHEFDFKLICEYYSRLERQGPGSPEVTIKALGFVDNLKNEARIADIGCGTGGQTMVLAEHAPGHITGIDLFPDFIEIFNANSRKRNLQNRVKGIVGSMDNLPFEDETLDLIWSEGAIYNIGFERGLNQWHRLLKKGGFIAVSEASWFTVARPDEIDRFWKDAYPEIDIISNKVAQWKEPDTFPSPPSFCLKTAGRIIFTPPRFPSRLSFSKSTRATRMPRSWWRTSGMKPGCMIGTRRFTGMFSTSGGKSRFPSTIRGIGSMAAGFDTDGLIFVEHGAKAG